MEGTDKTKRYLINVSHLSAALVVLMMPLIIGAFIVMLWAHVWNGHVRVAEAPSQEEVEAQRAHELEVLRIKNRSK